MRRNFRNDYNALVFPMDHFGEDFFRLPFTVHLRSVNQAHAKLDSQTQRCSCSRRCATRPIRIKVYFAELSGGKIVSSLLTLCEEAARVVFLARDRTQSFNQRLALCAIVDHECVVFAMR
jgi:hypothetical protein